MACTMVAGAPGAADAVLGGAGRSQALLVQIYQSEYLLRLALADA